MTDRRSTGLRRDLGVLDSYATMIGIVVGAGIFRVTSDAWARTGSSVILGYVVLAPVIFATAISYAVFASTSLGRQPGGEYAHIARVLGSYRLAFLGAWLKTVSYLGALAYLTSAFADYVLALLPDGSRSRGVQILVALATLTFFLLLHGLGVRWFARLQVAMCAVLAVSIVVLVVPGLFALKPENYRPVFSGGGGGFVAALPLLFFAYAGFEAVVHTGGEVEESSRRLPRVLVLSLLITTLVFTSMSIVTFGALPGRELAESTAPMADVAAVFLPPGLSWVVTLGALMAIATSINTTMLVPSRLAVMAALDGRIPAWLGRVDRRTGTPLIGLVATYAAVVALIVSGQIAVALDIAVFALVLLYFVHSGLVLLLPRLDPELFAETRISRPVQVGGALLSMAAMGVIIAVQVFQDVGGITGTEGWSFMDRWRQQGLTAVELLGVWVLLGLGLYGARPRQGRGKPGTTATAGRPGGERGQG